MSYPETQVEILRDTLGGMVLQIISLQAQLAAIKPPEVTNVSS